MNPNDSLAPALPQDIQRCAAFHGHLCPGLVYGALIAREAVRLLGIERALDEEIVAVSENDSCAVDGLQVLLGTTAGKGNLIVKDFGKNAYTVLHRDRRRAYRFCRKTAYAYSGKHPEEFRRLEAALAAGTADAVQRQRQKQLKAADLLAKPFGEVFDTAEVDFSIPPYARLAPSKPCAACGEMTMATKMVGAADGRRLCVPCSQLQA
ncbi:MAG: FmdE family protein [Desulfobacterales bacterium]|nr:FmdE family protein [Desulfobacterales bacterium]